LRSQVSMTDTLHFQSYNLLNFENEPGNDRSDHFRTIINEIRPDVLAVQELIELSGANMFLDSVLLPLDTNYALATFIASYDTDRGLYYRKDKYEFISSESIDTELRDINQVKLRHTGSDMEFIVFILHLKASNGEESQRAREVDSLRKVTDLLPDSIPFIVCGDFNMYDENEPGYLGLLDMSASGYVIDPLQDSLTTTWNNSANTRFHTQSTRTTNFGGGSTGGLDDRFDMILFNQMIADPGGMDYVDGSTYPYGNDGNHYNEAINAMPNTAVSVEVANALHQASDHLTLIAQFTFTYEVDTTEEDTTIVHLPAMEQEFHVTVYPQPANDVVFIETGQEFTYTWISDLQGRELSEPQRLISTRSQLDVSGYTPGIYLLHVVGESQHLTRPLLIAN
jgi:endonuclease/exonuclease/phosphatase family metal-dependent hydrolase